MLIPVTKDNVTEGGILASGGIAYYRLETNGCGDLAEDNLLPFGLECLHIAQALHVEYISSSSSLRSQ